MHYGIEATNSFGHVIFADVLNGLYFHGKANVVSVSNPNWGIDNNAGGATFVKYAIGTNEQFIIPFIEQRDGLLFSLVRCYKSGGAFYIDVAFSGSVPYPPACYVFSKAMLITNDNYGIQAFRKDGSLAFDSRCEFLQVKSINAISQQSTTSIGLFSGASGSVQNIADPKKTDSTHWYGDVYSNRDSLTAKKQSSVFYAKARKPIVFLPSLGVAFKKADWTYSHTDYWRSVSGVIFNNYSYSRSYTDWALYRQAVCITEYSSTTGWVPMLAGQYYTTGPGTYVHAPSDQFLNSGQMEWHTSPTYIYSQFGMNVGSIPYINQSINIQPITAIVSDGLLYD